MRCELTVQMAEVKLCRELFKHPARGIDFHEGGSLVAERTASAGDQHTHPSGLVWRCQFLPASPRPSQRRHRCAGLSLVEQDATVGPMREGPQENGVQTVGE